jgi:hypothetical protein
MERIEKWCTQCGGSFTGQGKTCDSECRQERINERQTSIAARFVVLQRTLRDEKIYWRDDRLIHSERFYAALLEFGCTYCGVSLEGFKGHCLDRIDNQKKHTSNNVTACCPLCNRVKSSDESGFTFTEMFTFIGPAVRAVRTRRGNLGPKN